MESYFSVLIVALVLLSASTALLAIKLFFRREPALKGSCCQTSSPDKYAVDRSANGEGGGCGCGGNCGCKTH